MSEFNPTNYENHDSGQWKVIRENVTQEMLNEYRYGKSIAEQYDEKYGPDNWKWEADELSVLDQTKVALHESEHQLAHEALVNSVAFGENKTNDGIDATGLRAMAAAPVFGKVSILEGKQEEE